MSEDTKNNIVRVFTVTPISDDRKPPPLVVASAATLPTKKVIIESDDMMLDMQMRLLISPSLFLSFFTFQQVLFMGLVVFAT